MVDYTDAAVHSIATLGPEAAQIVYYKQSGRAGCRGVMVVRDDDAVGLRIAPLAEAEWRAETMSAVALLHPVAHERTTTARSWVPSELPSPVWVDVLLRHPE